MKEIRFLLDYRRNRLWYNMYVRGKGIADIRRKTITELEQNHSKVGYLLNPRNFEIHGMLIGTDTGWLYRVQRTGNSYRIGKDGKRI